MSDPEAEYSPPEGVGIIFLGLDDVEHYTPEQRREIASRYLPHERDARVRGTPSMGSGAIYPVAWDEVTCQPFEIPPYWPRVYALDVGWNRTAALWGAFDRSTDCIYLYAEYYRAEAQPSTHAAAIKARGDWMPGLIDPAARGRSQIDGTQLIALYREHGLKLTPAANEVEAGIYAVWERLSTGRLKVFKTLQSLAAEYRLYRRDEKGRIVKANDHLLDAMRYLVMSGRAIARPLPAAGGAVLWGSGHVADRVAGY